jgi:hypothetical protein
MADSLVGSGYDQYIGTRDSTVSPGTTEFYNTQSGIGFESPQMLSNFINTKYGQTTDATNVFDTLKTGYTSPTATVSVQPSTQIDSSTLQAPKTQFDIQSLLQQNQTMYQQYQTQQKQFQDQYLQALKPDDNITNLQKQLSDLRTQSLNTEISGRAGIQAAGQKVVPMEFIVGQQQNIAQQANLQLQTLAAQQAPLVDQLNFAQQSRTQTLQALETLMKFGQENFQTAREQLTFSIELQKMQKELEQLDKAEQAAAKQFALENGVTKPFYDVGGTVYRSSDGKAYSTPEEAKADGVDITTWSNVQKIAPKIEPATSGIAEYEYAKSQGFTGTYQQWTDRQSQYKYTPGDGTGSQNDEIDQYAQDVYSGKLNLSSVPSKIRSQVSTKVDQLRASKYDSEFEARVDYDTEIREIEKASNAGESVGTPSELINAFVAEYGKYISQQEIQATIYKILDI